MPKPSYRDKILSEGLRVVHERGFGSASVRDIVKAAGATLGSFTNHFASKEAFALEVIDLYFVSGRETMRRTLLNEELPPLVRLRNYFAANKAHLNESNARNGCLYGNFTAEASDHPAIRERILAIFAEVQSSFASALKAAVQSGDAPADLDCDETAAFLVTAMQGANLLTKINRNVTTVDRVEKILFEQILHQSLSQQNPMPPPQE